MGQCVCTLLFLLAAKCTGLGLAPHHYAAQVVEFCDLFVVASKGSPDQSTAPKVGTVHFGIGVAALYCWSDLYNCGRRLAVAVPYNCTVTVYHSSFFYWSCSDFWKQSPSPAPDPKTLRLGRNKDGDMPLLRYPSIITPDLRNKATCVIPNSSNYE